MRIASPLLKRVLYPGLSKAGYLRWPTSSAPAVVTYHGILPVGYSPRGVALDGHLISAETFRSQLSFFKSKCNLISPEEFRSWCEARNQLPPRSVLLTCDDGLLNTLTEMLPIVREFGAHLLFFVTGASTLDHSSTLWYEQLYLWLFATGEVSIRMPWRNEAYIAQGKVQKRSLWQELIAQLSAFDFDAREHLLRQVRIQIGISENWEAEYSQNEPLRRRFFMLNRSELHQVAGSGITIGAHTMSHPMLSQMHSEQAFWEVAESRARLEQALNREVWALAYPFGTSQSVTSREYSLAQRARFTCGFLNTEHHAAHGSFDLPRIHISAGMNLPELEARLCGLHQHLRQTFATFSERAGA